MAANAQHLAWMTCDGIHIDPMTGKHTLLGVFSTLQARTFPVVHPRMIWFLTLTDLPQGTHTMTGSMSLPEQPLRQLVKREFKSTGPAQRINLINDIHNLKFEEPGNYTIIIDINDRTLLATTLPVLRVGGS